MSLLQKTDVYQRSDEKTARKSSDYSFILAVICMALAILVASAIFKPAPVGGGINFSEITSVGP